MTLLNLEPGEFQCEPEHSSVSLSTERLSCDRGNLSSTEARRCSQCWRGWALHRVVLGASGTTWILWGCLLPSPLHPEASVALDCLGANTAGALLSALVKCRRIAALTLKELKEQGAGRGMRLTHLCFLHPKASLVSWASLMEASRSLWISQPELGC